MVVRNFKHKPPVVRSNRGSGRHVITPETDYFNHPGSATPATGSVFDERVKSLPRTRIGRVCHDCGATAHEATFPGTRKPPRKIDRCTDCIADLAQLSEASPAMARLTAATARLVAISVQTRASYRAGYRHRAKQAQGDLVDLVVPPP